MFTEHLSLGLQRFGKKLTVKESREFMKCRFLTTLEEHNIFVLYFI